MAARKSSKKELVIPPQRKEVVKVVVGGPILVIHRFSDKAKREMLEAQTNAARNKKEPRNPEAEYNAARYTDSKDRDCARADAFKKAMIHAASFVAGVTKVQIRGSVFVRAKHRDEDGVGLVLLKYKRRYMREDPVRLPNGNADLRYRPCYIDWSTELEIEFDPDALSKEQVHHLVQRAGFSVGVHEHRPQKDGEWGRFEILNATTKQLKSVA